MLASEIANRCIYNQVEKDCKINLSNRQIICIWQFLPVVANSAPATVTRCSEAIPDVAAGPFGRSRGPGLVLVARATVAMWANRNRGAGNLVDCGNADGVVFLFGIASGKGPKQCAEAGWAQTGRNSQIWLVYKYGGLNLETA